MNSSNLNDSQKPIRIAIIASTGGSVYRETCQRSSWLRDRVNLVITDRDCGAMDAAIEMKQKTEKIPYNSARQFSEEVYRVLIHNRIDLAITFYTRLLAEPLISAFAGRLINLHPSLLPACPGLNGFEDSIKSGARIIGSTTHFIKIKADDGPSILQSCIHRGGDETITSLRHRIFEQQCQSLLQVAHWLEEQRIVTSKDFVQVIGSSTNGGEFSPALEAEDAISLFKR